jgi:hypothetical protein
MRMGPMLVLLLAVATAAAAQVYGVPASVTSMPRGATSYAQARGVPASVTSLGPNGWNGCCSPGAVVLGRNPRARLRLNLGGPPPLVFVPIAVPVVVVPPVLVMPAEVENESGQSQPAEVMPVSELEEAPVAGPEQRYGVHQFHPVVTAEESGAAAKFAEKPVAEPISAAKQPLSREESKEEPPATVLVFRDGRRLEVQNYAIQQDTLFDLSAAHRMKRIPLAELDLEATRTANASNGVDFVLP